MLKIINGLRYAEMLESGIKNVVKNKKALNDLNVFPVPDGDTGTNMVMTLRGGYNAIAVPEDALSVVSKQFATSAVYGARGNSGVILSQFFKGIAEAFKEKREIDAESLLVALETGSQFAYKAVVKPVEGTMLTVVREAVENARRLAPFNSINELIQVYVEAATKSLERTPTLLPILKKAGVVDSGGSGILCFFKGVQMYLNGEDIEAEEEIAVSTSVDLSLFNKDTRFVFGYCIEGLLQLKMDALEFNQAKLQEELTHLGGSIVMTLEGDKLKLHIHSKTPGRVINSCQVYGEFLTIKIENMTVQNLDKLQTEEKLAKLEKPKKFLYAEEKSGFDFAVVAVVPNAYLQQRFFEMGADVVILSEIAPSAQDFLDAFHYAKSDKILVFPNSSNSILTSMQAASLYKKARACVLNSRSVEECYLSLGLIDFEEGIQAAVDIVNETIGNLYQACIYQAVKDVQYNNQRVNRGDFFSLCGKQILETGESVEAVVMKTVQTVLREKDSCVLTLFYGAEMSEEFIDILVGKLQDKYPLLEITSVPTRENICDIVLAFE